jgi:hypothetical protein
MRFTEFIKEEPQQLDELNLKQAAAGASLLGALGMGSLADPAYSMTPQEQYRTDMANAIAQHYHIKPDEAKEIVDAAHEEGDRVFPKPHDLLALTGVESSFNKNATPRYSADKYPKTNARIQKDTPFGLLQVRPGLWKVPAGALSTIKGQIHHGKEVLKYYYKKFHGDKVAAMNAYHMGETDYRKHGANPEYTQKYQAEIQRQQEARLAAKQARLQQQRQAAHLQKTQAR